MLQTARPPEKEIISLLGILADGVLTDIIGFTGGATKDLVQLKRKSKRCHNMLATAVSPYPGRKPCASLVVRYLLLDFLGAPQFVEGG